MRMKHSSGPRLTKNKLTGRATGSFRRQQGIWLLVLLLTWETITRLGLVNSLLLPPMSLVMLRLVQGLFDGTLLLQWLQSVGMVFTGMVTGGLLAFSLVCLAWFFPRTRPLLELLSSALHPLPGIALLPLVLAVAGIGTKAVFVVILHAVVWSSYLSMGAGFRSVDSHLIDVAENLGANRLQLVMHVLLPVSLPQVVVGLKVGWSRGWRALISAEMIFSAIGSLGGIGWYLFERRAFMDMTGMYAGVVLVIVTGLLVENGLFRRWLPDQWRTD